jgi:hypothetical protein
MPGYDRTALVRQIRERLKDHAQCVSWQDQDTQLTLVVTGCPNACADIRAVSHKPLFFITQPQDAERFITLINARPEPRVWTKSCPGARRKKI